MTTKKKRTPVEADAPLLKKVGALVTGNYRLKKMSEPKPAKRKKPAESRK
jgi:hypothetical protein